MKLFTRLIILGVLSTAMLAAATVHTTYADELTADRKEKIQANCLSTKTTLTQLQVSDALLRVNRGQLYESMATKLMDRFNARLASNDFDTSNFSAITKDYRSALNNFRIDYQSYADQLSASIAIDCRQQPQAFYDSLEAARSKRSKVHDDVVTLNGFIANYQSGVNALSANYQQVSGAGPAE